MSHDDASLRAALELEARRVVDLEADSVDRAVPWADSWTVGAVVGHLGGVQRWATALCADPGSKLRRRDIERPPTGAEVLAWYAAGVEPMLAAFDGTDPETIVHTWAGPRPRRWWLRRLAHETAVHRWDAQAGATGMATAAPIEAALAVDGIDELFEDFLPLVGQSEAGAGQTLHVHATDAEGEWQLTFGRSGIDVERRHAKADAAVRGGSHDLLLLLWNRTTVDTTPAEVFGDRDVLERWRRSVQF